jgi:hypothetical protein
MPVVRPHARRFFALILVTFGVLGAGLGRPAEAAGAYKFSQVFTLSEANLSTIDAFGAYWAFNGKFFLDTALYFDYFGGLSVTVMGYADAKGLNYRRGARASLEIFFSETVPAEIDPVDHVLRAKIPFWIYLGGAGGGYLPAQMRIAIYQEGVDITGITIGSFEDY